ncbi:hypothetical protein AK812_SmicGene28430 [Symbiodinium microadriaticum]|uniref:Uncharacterized protein n=1 Tax=Symbiodinium microadriaticum TaxID=2951 RepID=A0A1Q9D4G5_SYMMI|nr:hypothetical protein AK812_SmicGene28430 [Symbiodinium microadriaticum]
MFLSEYNCRTDNKPAPLRAQLLGVRAFLSPACQAKSGALVLALVPARSSTSIERGHKGCIDSNLRAAPERESICDDLDAAIIEALGVDVEVAHQNIVAPALRQTRAAARSRGSPRERKMPERGQAARWSPRGSTGRRQRQAAASRGKSKRNRRSNKARKIDESKVNANATRRPPAQRRKHLS